MRHLFYTIWIRHGINLFFTNPYSKTVMNQINQNDRDRNNNNISGVFVAATIFWRKNAQLEWHKTAISDVTKFYKQRKHALCEKYYDAVFALIENFLTGNWAA